MKRFLSLLFILFPIIAGAQNLQKVTFCPQWTPQSQFAGFYIAKEKGFYREQGLDVDIIILTTSGSAMQKLKDGEADIISSQLIDAMVCRDNGVPLVNFLQMSHHNSLMIITRKPMESIKDLNRMKIGRWKHGFFELAMAFTTQNALDVEWISFISNIALFTSGAIDGTMAMSYNEYDQLLSTGYPISPKHILRFSQIGYDVPEDGLYATKDYFDKNKVMLKKFAEATKKGWNWARKQENRDEALEIVMKVIKDNNVPTNRNHQKWMLNEILELQEDETGTAPFFLSKERFEFARNFLFEFSFIFSKVSYEDFVMNY